MNKKDLLKKIVILVTILVVPGFLYYLLQEKGKNRYRPLGIYGPKKVASTFHSYRGLTVPDTIYHKVDSFSLTNQEGALVRFPIDTGKIMVVNFFYTRCNAFCDKMNGEMGRVVNAYEKNPLLRFFTITVDPEVDTPGVLRDYSAKFGARAGKWDFLTGEKKKIFSIARKGFLVEAVEDTSAGGAGKIIHSTLFVLVDPQRRIRGFYDSNNREEVDRLNDEIKVLIAEELRKVTNR